MDYNNCILVVLFFFVKQNMSEVIPFMGVASFLWLKNQRFYAILLIASKNVQSFLTELRYGVTLFFL